MQAANAQGIMGLMSQGRAPQQPQQAPSPDKASPMAGLGSVEDRVAAYRGNPAPLQQRYAMSQDLLDLLALQKIKSEKEAAARDMQLKMGQQQAAQGQEPQTIAQQREKEVMELTKNELAQQRGETAEQQTEQQQAAMQKMMGGIAAAPGAQAAAQPKAMAAGGIVAFSTGDSVEDPRRKRREGESFADFRRRMFDLDLQIQRERNAARDSEREAERQRRLAERGNEVIPPSPFFDRKPLEMPGAAPQAPAAERPADPSTVGLRGTMGDQAGDYPTAPTTTRPPAAPSNVRAAPVERPAPTPAAAPAAPAPARPAPGAPAEGLAALVDKTATGMMQQDPEAKRKAMQEEIRASYALTPEQRAVYEEGIAQRRKMFDETYDPERQRNEGLKQFLLGAGGRRYNVLGGAAQTAGAFDERQRQAKLRDFEAVQKSREELVGKEREGIKPSIEGGLKALEQYSMSQRGGLDAGFRRVEGALDRESRELIARENNRVQAMIAQAQREGTAAANAARNSQEINRLETRALAEIQKGPTAKGIAMLEQTKAMNPKGFSKEQQAELDALYKKLDDAQTQVYLQMDTYREAAGIGVGKGGAKSVNMTPEQKAALEKYTKGK